jgi:hypothetical protein
MEAITRIAQIAEPMIVFTVLLLQDAHSEASSNYGAMAQGAIEGFLRCGYCQWTGVLGVEAFGRNGVMATIQVRTGAGRYELNVELGQHMIFTRLRLVALFLAAVASTTAGGACFAQTQSPKHTIVVTFDYDFTAVPACSEKVSKKCIAKFVVYDISGEKPYKLFTIPVPAGATGKVKGISGESQPLLFESGKHLLGVSAQRESGEESNPHATTVWVTIP